MRKILLLVIILALMACQSRVSENQLRNEVSAIPMIYTVEAEVQVLVEGHGENGTNEWKSFFGKRDIIIPVKAHVKVGIDLSKLSDMNVEGDKVYITLPDPTIELESTEILWDEVVSDVSGMRSGFTAKEQEFLTQQGKMKIMGELPDMDLVQPAQEHAEQVLGNMISALGYKAVFRARPVYEEFDFVRLINDVEDKL